MKVSSPLPTGVTALLFDAARKRRQLEARCVDQLQAAGYQEIILPIVDYMEPYERLLTASTREELYRLVDRDGQTLALRADFTPMLARLLTPRLVALELPLRLYYRGDVVRYQEDRAGREREFYQVGAELLGESGPRADLEVLELFLGLLTEGVRGLEEDLAGSGPVTGVPAIHVVLGYAGALDELLTEAVGTSDLSLEALLSSVHRRQRRVAARAGEALLQVVERGVPDDPAALGEAHRGTLERLGGLARDLEGRYPGVRVTVDLAEFVHQTRREEILEVAGDRAYYDGLVFRAYVGDQGLPVGGGGRYDRLFRELDADVAAAGFSLGLERLLKARRVVEGEGEVRAEALAEVAP